MIDELELSGRTVLVWGSAATALPIITRLLGRDARVHVVAETLTATIADLPGRRGLTVEQRAPRAEDLDAVALVVAATGSADQDTEVGQLAAARNKPAVLTARPPRAATEAERPTGRVILVGGGPGPVGLLTVAGQQAVRVADVIITDRLAPLEALAEARADAEIIDVAKIPRGDYTPQERINQLLVEHAQAGRLVVRLKGGDNFVFGRGGEEWQACAAAGIAVEVVPGVTSAVAAPALVGVPVTHRQLTQGFTVVSAHLPPGHAGSTLDWGALARANTTLVIMMGVATLPAVTEVLMQHGMDPSTPALAVADAGLPRQRAVRTTLRTLAADAAAADISAPAITVIGAVAGFDPGLTT